MIKVLNPKLSQILDFASKHPKLKNDHKFKNPTRTHPDREPLGWSRLLEMVEKSSVPVFALGGLSYLDVVSARQIGCQGIAVQSSLWNCADPAEYLREVDRSLPYLDYI